MQNIYCVIGVWWIGSGGEATDRVKRTLVSVFKLLQRVSCSLMLTINKEINKSNRSFSSVDYIEWNDR